jgi:ERCC4-type nuclease
MRERAVWGELQEFEAVDTIQVTSVVLDIGDFVLSRTTTVPGNEGEEPTQVTKTIVIERKTFNDHCASILDGRRKEQTSRALAMRERDAPNMTFVLLIEGTLPGWDGVTGPMKNKNAHAALSKSAIRDSIPVLYTKNVEHTACLIMYMANAMAADGFDPVIKATERAASGYAG